jgi:hypothetical protein
MFEEAIVILWRLVCGKCLLNELPNFKNIPDSSLSLDADGDGNGNGEINLREPL